MLDAVAAEMERVLDADGAMLLRYEPDEEVTVIARRVQDSRRVPLGTRISHQGESVSSMVRRTGRPPGSGITSEHEVRLQTLPVRWSGTSPSRTEYEALGDLRVTAAILEAVKDARHRRSGVAVSCTRSLRNVGRSSSGSMNAIGSQWSGRSSMAKKSTGSSNCRLKS